MSLDYSVATPFGDVVIKQNIGFLTIRKDFKEHLSVPEIKLHYQMMKELTNGQKIPFVIDVTRSKPFILEFNARKLILAKYDESAASYAFISEDVAHSFFINLFFKIVPSKIPMRIFHGENHALHWINELEYYEVDTVPKMA